MILISVSAAILSSLFGTGSFLDSTDAFHAPLSSRRAVISSGGGALAGSFFGNLFDNGSNASNAFPAGSYKSAGSTNEIKKVVEGMRWRRLGGSDMLVSELALGTQRWCGADFNSPDQSKCFEFMDEAILKGGVNLIDTAEQYPIPSGSSDDTREGATEVTIGKWIKERKVPRDRVIIASKITGGRNITPRNIKANCEDSLKRLQTDYIDVYQLHWPQRYSRKYLSLRCVLHIMSFVYTYTCELPFRMMTLAQSNWGQSLKYNIESDSSSYWRQFGGPTSFEDLCIAMENLIQEGKIRGWGLCNDNAYGLTACTRTAKALGVTPPCSIQVYA